MGVRRRVSPIYCSSFPRRSLLPCQGTNNPRLLGWLTLNPRQVALFPIIPRFGDRDCGLEDSGRCLPDRYLAYASVRFAPHKIDTEKTVAQIGRFDLDAVGQHKSAAKLPGGDAAMDKLACLL